MCLNPKQRSRLTHSPKKKNQKNPEQNKHPLPQFLEGEEALSRVNGWGGFFLPRCEGDRFKRSLGDIKRLAKIREVLHCHQLFR